MNVHDEGEELDQLNGRNIWVLEDEESSIFVYHDVFDVRYQLQFFAKIAEFISASTTDSRSKPDLIIADLKLKDGHFMRDCLAKDRAIAKRCPVIIVSSSDDIDVLRLCFDYGAVDYLVKPFSKTELLAKVERIVGRSLMVDKPEKANLPISVHAAQLMLKSKNGQTVYLTLKEMAVFRQIWEAFPNSITRQELFQKVWPESSVVEKTLEVHISNLRKKLMPLDAGITLAGDEAYRLIIQKE